MLPAGTIEIAAGRGQAKSIALRLPLRSTRDFRVQAGFSAIPWVRFNFLYPSSIFRWTLEFAFAFFCLATNKRELKIGHICLEFAPVVLPISVYSRP